MRSTLALVVALGSFAGPASAHPTGGGGGGHGGGGGALGQVSGALGRATAGPSSTSRGGDSRDHRESTDRPLVRTEEAVVIVGGPERDPDDLPPGVTPPGTAHLDVLVAGEKVHDSDGAFTIEAALVDGWARIGGSVTQFYEGQRSGETLTLTVPTFTIGARIDDGGPTRVYLEGGVVGAKTKHDPVMDTSIVGAIGGVRLEHALSPRLALIGDAQAMLFEQGVRARGMRVGLRLGMLQASLRVLDFNVGPALWGPEVGLRF